MRRTIERVRAEFIEMPGLCVTTAQACRLWGVDEVTCRGVLEALSDVGFLRVNQRGMYARATDGYLPSLPPVTSDDLACAAGTDVPVLLTGGTASARLAVACEIHEARGPFGKTFVSAKLGAALTNDMPPGTVYLEEIARLGTAAQGAVSRWLEHRPSGVCLISATGVEPAAAVAAGRLDPTLFYRLNLLRFHLAPSTLSAQPRKS